MTQTASPLALGIDFGTSGARAIAVVATGEAAGSIRAMAGAKYDLTQTSARDWQLVLEALLADLPVSVRCNLGAIACNGTSATVVPCAADGAPLADPLLYNDSRAATVLPELRAIAPPEHAVLSASSSLAKLLWWQQQPEFTRTRWFLHQADWVEFCLHGQLGISDYHNALKLGYDPARLRYPDWLQGLAIATLLPRVLAPGTPIAPIDEAIALRFDLPAACTVRAGTTDSIAAFLAAGALAPGTAVTSLGSTLVLKLLSERRVEAAQYGIYSHRLGHLWLAGGASNTGGAVLQQFFSANDLRDLSACLDPEHPSELDYYPLPRAGERFPIADPELLPRLQPRPDDPVAFLHGLLESMSRIETLGYCRLQELGATPLQRVYTAGGGALNVAWERIRARHLKVPVAAAQHSEAAYGTALLAAGQFDAIVARLPRLAEPTLE
ncbi:sugar (pentulose and hexulose) kinase [Rubidibacter lacunae KORDI 51-2]|uniref:D-ribulose kinase n=1 Tax=Rubidibacter lacunae KORDI 51-2 TaxID=582515 RepID=U5DNU4_9CHRO|nr:FGGY-family carbohydrate kinase [Rubidibacter lacunae]ERN42532.1 sugar (pentulose and hexulose) kinase [Rubidibacter lacunae KORDI 51-2]